MARLIKPDGTETIVAPKSGKFFKLEEMQEYVGGLIQQISLAPGEEEDIMVMNEEGKFLNLESNHKATELLHRAGGMFWDVVVGNVLLLKWTEVER